MQIPLLVVEARPPDGSAFHRAYSTGRCFHLWENEPIRSKSISTFMPRLTRKRRKVTGKAAQFNDLPELREAAEEALRRHGVRVIIVDEAHHMMYTGSGGPTVTLQEQLEWLKSMSNATQVLHILVGPYNLFNFGHLNGQLSRRCLPVHFPRYQLQREEDCIEFQAALLALLHKVPLHCDANTLVASYLAVFLRVQYWLYRSLEGLAARAVSAAWMKAKHFILDSAPEVLPLRWTPTRQMALDAKEGSQTEPYGKQSRTCMAAPARRGTDCSRPPSHVELVLFLKGFGSSAASMMREKMKLLLREDFAAPSRRRDFSNKNQSLTSL